MEGAHGNGRYQFLFARWLSPVGFITSIPYRGNQMRKELNVIIHNSRRDVEALEYLLSTLTNEATPATIHVVNDFSAVTDPPFASRLDDLAKEYKLDIKEAGTSLYAAMNGIIAGLPPNNWLLLTDANVEWKTSSVKALVHAMERDSYLRGVNPVLLTSWGPEADIAHLGTVTDSQGQLHYLYEGIKADSPLAATQRRFVLASEAAFMTRVGTLRKVGGFIPELAELSFANLCRRIIADQGGYYSSIPVSKAVQKDRFASWKECGLWNGLLWRDRLPIQPPPPSLHVHALADGLTVSLSQWLWPQFLELSPGHDEKFFSWRHDPNPKTLLAFLADLENRDIRTAMDMARQLPTSLPRQMAFYTHLASNLLAFARKNGLAAAAQTVEKWRKSARIFHHRHLLPGLKALRQSGIYNCSLDLCPAVYDAWLELSPAARPPRIECGADWPNIAVVMPVYNPEPTFLREAINSVKAQSYPHWQLCIADDCSTNAEIRPLLETELASDPRIKATFRRNNGHICHATNSALELVTAPWTAFLDNDDVLTPHALACVAQCTADNVDLGMIYSDEDHIDRHGCLRSPNFANSWDHAHIPAHLCAYRTDLLRNWGGLRPGLEGCQDTDLAIRAREHLEPRQFFHIPHILYHWRVHTGSTSATIGAKPYVVENTKKMLLQWAQRQNLPGEIVRMGHRLGFSVAHYVPQDFKGAVVIPCARNNLSPELAAMLETVRRHMRIEPVFIPAPVEQMANLSWFAPHMPYWQDIVRPRLDIMAADAVLFIHPALRPAPNCRPEQLLIQATLPRHTIVGSMITRNGILLNGGLYPDATGLPFQLLRGASDEALGVYNWGRFSTSHIALGCSWLCFACRPGILGQLPPDIPSTCFSASIMALKMRTRGESCIISPFGQWELASRELFYTPTEEEKTEFIARWGEEIRNCNLRHPLLRAAPDWDWTLELGAE